MVKLYLTVIQMHNYIVSQKCINFGNLHLQGAWIKFVQFCCKASEYLRKLCPCLIVRVHVMLTQHWRFSDVNVFISACNAFPAAARTPVNCTIISQPQQQPTPRPTFVWKLCHKLPNVMSHLFIQTLIKTYGAIVYKQSDWVTHKLHHFRRWTLGANLISKTTQTKTLFGHYFPKCADCVYHMLWTLDHV